MRKSLICYDFTQVNSTLNLIVTLEDEVGGGSRNNIVEQGVTVIILDENDNPPEFENVSFILIFFSIYL